MTDRNYIRECLKDAILAYENCTGHEWDNDYGFSQYKEYKQYREYKTNCSEEEAMFWAVKIITLNNLLECLEHPELR